MPTSGIYKNVLPVADAGTVAILFMIDKKKKKEDRIKIQHQ